MKRLIIILNIFCIVNCEVGHLRLVDRRLHILRKNLNAKNNYETSTPSNELKIEETKSSTSTYYEDTSSTLIESITKQIKEKIDHDGELTEENDDFETSTPSNEFVIDETQSSASIYSKNMSKSSTGMISDKIIDEIDHYGELPKLGVKFLQESDSSTSTLFKITSTSTKAQKKFLRKRKYQIINAEYEKIIEARRKQKLKNDILNKYKTHLF